MPRWLALVTRRHAWVPWIAMLVCLPALLGGIDLDDVFHAVTVSRGEGFLGTAFTGFGHAVRPVHLPLDDLPWWTDPGLQLDLWRPVAALTHWLDYTAWPRQPWLMHLHSVLWYGLLVAMVQRAYRAMGTTDARAGLAALMFGLAQAHAMNVGWVAARNSLIAATAVAAMLVVHARWRERGWTAGAIVGPGLLGLGLLANEGAVAGLGYLAGHALVRSPASPARVRGYRRAWSVAWPLLPYVIVVVAWRLSYRSLGYGALHSGMYFDPAGDPIGYVGRTLAHGTVLLAGRFGIAGLDALGGIPGAVVPAAIAGALFLGALVWIARTRLLRDRAARGWLLGMLLACITAGTTLPTDRGLLLIDIGAFFVIADLVLWARREGAPRARRWLGRGLLVLHLLLLPLLMPLRVLTPAWIQSQVERIAMAIPHAPGIEHTTVVMLHAPSDLLMIYNRPLATHAGRPFPARLRYLYAGPGIVTVERPAADRIVLESDQPWLRAPLDRLFRGDPRFVPGQRVPGPCLTAEIEQVDAAGLARRVAFTLHRSAPACTLVFMAWEGDVPVVTELPAIGESRTLPAVRWP